MTLVRSLAVGSVVLFSLAATARAQQPAPAGAPGTAAPTPAPAAEVPKKSPCTADVQVFCQGVPQGGGDVLRCLADKSDELSHSCKAHLADLKKNFMASAADCKGDVDKFCADVPHAGGRVVQCLRKRQKELSPTCDALLDKLFAAAGGTPPPAAAAPAAAAPAAGAPPAAPAAPAAPPAAAPKK